jgi:hypothetical protein
MPGIESRCQLEHDRDFHGRARCGSLVGGVGTFACVKNRSQRLPGEIEAGALDQKTPIGDLCGR